MRGVQQPGVRSGAVPSVRVHEQPGPDVCAVHLAVRACAVPGVSLRRDAGHGVQGVQRVPRRAIRNLGVRPDARHAVRDVQPMPRRILRERGLFRRG